MKLCVGTKMVKMIIVGEEKKTIIREGKEWIMTIKQKMCTRFSQIQKCDHFIVKNDNF
jgi:hypothetical protein